MEDNSSPATKQDIEAVLKAVRELEGNLRTEFSTRLEAVETKLLGAFFSYQEYDRIENRKFRVELSSVTTTSDLRFDNLENRVAAIEKTFLSRPGQPQQQP